MRLADEHGIGQFEGCAWLCRTCHQTSGQHEDIVRWCCRGGGRTLLLCKRHSHARGDHDGASENGFHINLMSSSNA
jgi:hypothetical protein